MKENLETHSSLLHPINRRANYGSWLLLGTLLTLGLLFRFSNLGRRIYWHDEAYTSLWASGFSIDEVIAELSNGSEISAQALLMYQRPSPEKSILDTIRSTITGDPHHPPLYYLMSHFWMHHIGYSPAAMRSLATVISLFVLPALYWLSLELFGSRRTALFAVALISVSPIHILLAREAREYTLWTVSTLLSSATLIRALRLKSRSSWALYAGATVLGLYSHLLFAIVLCAQGLYMVITIKVRRGGRILSDKSLVAYLLATSVALVAFTPWIVVIITHYRKIIQYTNWMSMSIPLIAYIKRSAANYSRVFVDVKPFPEFVQLVFILPVVILVGYSLYFLWKRGPNKAWIFVFLLVGTTAVVLTLPDLILGGQRSAVCRYLIPSFIGIGLAVAYFLTTQLSTGRVWKKRIWQLVTLALFLVSIFSNVLIVQAYSWWDKGSDYGRPQMIRAINEADQALFIVESSWANFGYFLGFSHELDPHVRLSWGSNVWNDIRGRYSDIFLYRPSAAAQKAIAANPSRRFERVIPKLLWRLAEN